jgi:DNA-binding PadR family transcriptional regulator
MTELLAWILCALGWFIVVSLVRRNLLLRRELVLALLRLAPREHLPILGRDLVAMSGGALQPGTIHVTLAELEDEGLVLSEPLLFDPLRRHVYAASRRGGELHDARIGRSVAPSDTATQESEES